VLRIKSGDTVESGVAADLSITELVDDNKGVHMSIPKSIFASGGAK
jgi:acetamidase/formamidase